MNLRIIAESQLEQPNIGYFKGAVDYKYGEKPMVKFRRVHTRRGRKIVLDFYGELVHLEGSEDIKVLLPLKETTEYSITLKLAKGDFFMAQCGIKLSNPRKLVYRQQILYDVEYI